MQENLISFINTSPLFIAIIIGFVVSLNENASIRVPIIIVIISTIISFLLPIFNLKSWVTYPVILSESAVFVLATMLFSQKMKKWLAWILGLIVGFVWAIVLLILLGVTFNI
ncbi:hypothetical protein [Lactobacillus intestinalis]|uniref:Integral membrane protein n=1 Tax=Lactobacillus intestinalis DSM 6629 TaxID=1423761 RepID=A0ABR5PN05_9LACO|nr:hypothetical protein [Lactobacillus intestinalis]KRM31734.1 hypothetical protein FC44_GL000432 [Lactobacillus intestinalis DSM 6629]UTW41252.1 hypothetical protein KBW87_09075 [Lactobacillus intestinalis]